MNIIQRTLAQLAVMEWNAEQQEERARRTVFTAAERIRADHDPADFPLLHHGPLPYERAVQIVEWWWSRNIHGCSLDYHLPAASSLEYQP